MWSFANFLMLVILITDLILLASGRLLICVKALGAQGWILAVFPFLFTGKEVVFHSVLLAVLALALRGIIFPLILRKAVEKVGVNREVEPFISFSASLLLGVIVFFLCLWLDRILDLPTAEGFALVVPVSLFSFFLGLFLIVTRKKAITQVMGYLVLENGVYMFGVGTAIGNPWIVEAGGLLDVLAAVFIMGIVMFHINREFDHIDSHQLTALSDWEAEEPGPEAEKQ